MKRFDARSVVVGMIISIMLVGGIAFASNGYETISVIKDAVYLHVNKDGAVGMITQPNFLYNDTTYVPLRAVAEMCGAEVEWHEDTSSVILNLPTSEKVYVKVNEPEQPIKSITSYKKSEENSFAYLMDNNDYTEALIGLNIECKISGYGQPVVQFTNKSMFGMFINGISIEIIGSNGQNLRAVTAYGPDFEKILPNRKSEIALVTSAKTIDDVKNGYVQKISYALIGGGQNFLVEYNFNTEKYTLREGDVSEEYTLSEWQEMWQ